MVSKKQLKNLQVKAEDKLEKFSKALSSFSDFSKNLDSLGMFGLGMYIPGPGSPLANKLISGVEVLVTYKLAQSPNLAASVFGVGLTAANIKLAYDTARGVKHVREGET